MPDGDVETAAALVRQHGLTVTAISPGVFKTEPTEALIAEGIERLKRSLEVCRLLGCRMMVIFQHAAGRGTRDRRGSLTARH